MSKLDWSNTYCFWKGCELGEGVFKDNPFWESCKHDILYKQNKAPHELKAYLLGDWRLTVNEAVEYELGDYLEVEYGISRKRLDKYLENFNNVKLKGMNLHSINHSNGQTDWYDGDKLILTSVENLNGNGNFTIKSHWRE